MAALTSKRPILPRKGEHGVFLVAANVKCIEGGVAVLSGGYIRPGTLAQGLKPKGIFLQTVDNTGGKPGAKRVKVLLGLPGIQFKLDNSTTNPCAQTDVGSAGYIEDDHTIGNASQGATAAGEITQIDEDGVWIQMA